MKVADNADIMNVPLSIRVELKDSVEQQTEKLLCETSEI